MADLQQVDATKQTAQDVITGSTAVGRVENKGGADLKNSPRRTAQSEIRTPPHSIEAEQGVLGCILLEPQESLPLCIQRLKANENAFYDVRHRVIYEALLKMYEKKCVIDPVTVVQWLKDKNNLETAGGVVYITSLPDATPSAANLDYYLTIVRDKYFLRKMIYTCTDVISKIYDFSGDVEELLDNVETKVLMAGEERVEDTIDSVKDLVKKAIEQIEHYHQNKGMFSGILTGFSDLDKLTLGLQPGDMIVIAARPSVGKTSLAMNIVEHVAVDLQIPVGCSALK
ncbi:MAG TPA: DnaB-like helicase N-terminal domain-containing protein [Verrucomicrobiota bacterium]|nr:DnaB-like helicase N-terminal domain-containing protein [Verrucomicrobiota bacterium]